MDDLAKTTAEEPNPHDRESAVRDFGVEAVSAAEFHMRVGGIKRPIREAAAYALRWRDNPAMSSENWGE